VSQVYSVELTLYFADEEGAVKKFAEHISNDKSANYDLPRYAQAGATLESMDGIMKIYLAHLQREVEIEVLKDGGKYYCNDFNASYGWERVLLDMWKILKPYLKKGSCMSLCVDCDVTEYRV